MKRREFITLIGGAAAWPIAARAQQQPPRTIGYLSGRSSDADASVITAIGQGLSEGGYIEGRNVLIEYRWAAGRIDPLPTLAAEFVHRRVDLIIAILFPAALAAKVSTTTVPIVFTSGVDPVKAGLVASLNRPGGNLTGFSEFTHTINTKKLEIMRQLVPRGAFAVLTNLASPTAALWIPEIQASARSVEQELHILGANSEREIDIAFESLARLRPRALFVGAGALLLSQRSQIAKLCAHHAIPAIYSSREFILAGGLISYAADNLEIYRRVGHYAARILHGERPAELPVQQPTKFELIINLQTARVLGLTLPTTLLALADEVIE